MSTIRRQILDLETATIVYHLDCGHILTLPVTIAERQLTNVGDDLFCPRCARGDLRLVPNPIA